MISVSFMTTAQDFGSYLIPDTGVSIGVMEQMNADGELDAEESKVADLKVEAFFSNKSIYDVDDYDEVDDEVELELDKKVRTVIGEMSDDERTATLDRVRREHPEWMEHAWYALAILDSMMEADEISDEDLRTHAEVKLKPLDGEYDQDYYHDTAPGEIADREEKLTKLIQDRYDAMDSEQRKTAIRNARLNHLAWTPFRHEFLAMLDVMNESGDIPKELKPYAMSAINLELRMSFDDALEGCIGRR